MDSWDNNLRERDDIKYTTEKSMFLSLLNWAHVFANVSHTRRAYEGNFGALVISWIAACAGSEKQNLDNRRTNQKQTPVVQTAGVETEQEQISAASFHDTLAELGHIAETKQDVVQNDGSFSLASSTSSRICRIRWSDGSYNFSGLDFYDQSKSECMRICTVGNVGFAAIQNLRSGNIKTYLCSYPKGSFIEYFVMIWP